jgi:hypothetical protein
MCEFQGSTVLVYRVTTKYDEERLRGRARGGRIAGFEQQR